MSRRAQEHSRLLLRLSLAQNQPSWQPWPREQHRDLALTAPWRRRRSRFRCLQYRWRLRGCREVANHGLSWLFCSEGRTASRRCKLSACGGKHASAAASTPRPQQPSIASGAPRKYLRLNVALGGRQLRGLPRPTIQGVYPARHFEHARTGGPGFFRYRPRGQAQAGSTTPGLSQMLTAG